eukprot:650970-Hanusia_phi.AAC.1
MQSERRRGPRAGRIFCGTPGSDSVQPGVTVTRRGPRARRAAPRRGPGGTVSLARPRRAAGIR